MVSKRRTDIASIIPCFFDLQIKDAIKILHISTHTMMRIRKESGHDVWPFERIKRGDFAPMSWEEVKQYRERVMETASPEMREILEKCERKARLMRALYMPGAMMALAKPRVHRKKRLPVIVTRMAEPEPVVEKSDEQLFMEEFGLFPDLDPAEWNQPTEVPLFSCLEPETDADEFWACRNLEPTAELSEHWENMGRLLFEIDVPV